MYKLILSDDEPFIREGMRDLIDWNGLGFEIVGIFEDGGPVIEYLKNHTVDAIVTDIKMPLYTGLDIAKYAYENHLHTHIIFISGYQEIDLAMAAIKYNVSQYILKPVDIEELKNQLITIKKELDKERENRSNQFSLEYYKHSIEELKEDFFIELATGSFSNEAYLTNMFHLLYPNLDLTACPCCQISLRFQNYGEYIKNHWKHTNSELHRCLQNCIQLCSSSLEYRMIRKDNDTIELFGLLIQPTSHTEIDSVIHNEVSRLCRELRETFYMEAELERLSIYDDILEFSRNCISALSADDPSFLLNLHEQEKLLFSSLGSEKEKTFSILEHLITYFKRLNFSVAQELASEMLTVFHTQLSQRGLLTSTSLLDSQGTSMIEQAQNFSEMETALQKIFSDFTELQDQGEAHEDNLIANAKNYIMEHITEDISLESISEKFYLSQYYFSRIFKLKTGENLIDYIVRQKIEKSKQLLKNPKYKVYEISQMVGYQSNRYFTKVFKNHTGYTPSEYRAHYYR